MRSAIIVICILAIIVIALSGFVQIASDPPGLSRQRDTARSCRILIGHEWKEEVGCELFTDAIEGYTDGLSIGRCR